MERGLKCGWVFFNGLNVRGSRKNVNGGSATPRMMAIHVLTNYNSRFSSPREGD